MFSPVPACMYILVPAYMHTVGVMTWYHIIVILYSYTIVTMGESRDENTTPINHIHMLSEAKCLASDLAIYSVCKIDTRLYD